MQSNPEPCTAPVIPLPLPPTAAQPAAASPALRQWGGARRCSPAECPQAAAGQPEGPSQTHAAASCAKQDDTPGTQSHKRGTSRGAGRTVSVCCCVVSLILVWATSHNPSTTSVTRLAHHCSRCCVVLCTHTHTHPPDVWHHERLVFDHLCPVKDYVQVQRARTPPGATNQVTPCVWVWVGVTRCDNVRRLWSEARGRESACQRGSDECRLEADSQRKPLDTHTGGA